MSHFTPRHVDLVAELLRLRNRVAALEQVRTGYANVGVLHMLDAETPEIPTQGPNAGGGFLYVQGGALKWIGPTDTPHQIAAP